MYTRFGMPVTCRLQRHPGLQGGNKSIFVAHELLEVKHAFLQFEQTVDQVWRRAQIVEHAAQKSLRMVDRDYRRGLLLAEVGAVGIIVADIIRASALIKR